MQDDFKIHHEHRGVTGRLAAVWGRFLRSGALTAIALCLLFGGTHTLVAPGETLQWHVRVEALAESTSSYVSSAQ